MKRRITVAAMIGIAVVASNVLAAADTRTMTRVGVGAAPAGASKATPGGAIQAAISGRQTGIFRSSTMRLNSGGGTVETLAVVENGRITDLHARRGGQFLTRRGSAGIRAASAATFQALAGYGVDVPITDPARRTAFLNAAHGASGGSTAPAAAPPPCPADYARANPVKKRMLEQQPAYAGCLLTALPPAPGTRSASTGPAMPGVVRELAGVLGIPAAMAADYSMIFFEVSLSNFFDNWGFEYVPGEYVAVNIGGARGVWANTGG